MTEDEMDVWHYRLNGHEFEQALGVGDGQGSLACCSPWGCKELEGHRCRVSYIQIHGYRGEGWVEGIVRELGMNMYTLLYLKWITNKDPLLNTGNSAQCFVAVWMGGEFGGEWVPYM